MAPREPDETAVRLLADPRNRAILAELEGAGVVDVDALAERLADRDEEPTVSEDESERLRIELRHTALPALDDAGLVSFDPATASVAIGSRPGRDGAAFDEIRDRLDAVANADGAVGVEVLEGRDEVIDRGQRLFESADEELFLVITTDGLLERGCLDRLQDAVDRGVEVAVGSPTIGVRDLVRRSVPDATIWEPQRDVASDPAAHPALGRLVVADRRAVMVGRLDDRDEPTERAIAAAGPANPLVVLVRELLGPRLDHLDYQSEDFRQHLPF